MKLTLQIDLPESQPGRYRNVMAARRLLAGLALQAGTLPTPNEQHSPMRDDNGHYAGCWRVVSP